LLGVITDSPAALPLRVGSCSIVGQSLPVVGGGGALTLNVTGITAGDPDAPVVVTVTFPEYEPAGRPVKLVATCTCCEGGAVPEEGDAESQVWLTLSVKLRVPLPVLLIVNAAGGGLTPFSTAVKTRLDGETERTGCAEAAAEA